MKGRITDIIRKKKIVEDWNGDGEGLNFQLIANCLLINAVPSTTYFVFQEILLHLTNQR